MGLINLDEMPENGVNVEMVLRNNGFYHLIQPAQTCDKFLHKYESNSRGCKVLADLSTYIYNIIQLYWERERLRLIAAKLLGWSFCYYIKSSIVD